MNLRVAWRTLWASPRVTLVVVLTLGVGIALITLVFTLLNGYLWRALPYQDAERVVSLAELGRQVPERSVSMPLPAYDALREQATSYQLLGAYARGGGNLRIGSAATLVSLVKASPTLLPLLRVPSFLGRTFEPGDAVIGAPFTILLTHRFWQTHFGADPAVLGRILYMSGQATIVVGVLPPSFEFEYADVWVPLRPLDRKDEDVNVLGRLRDEASFETARAEVAVLETRLQQAGLIEGKLLVHPEMVVRLPLPGGLHWLFLIGTFFVLAIACANVVNLLLARGVVRQSQQAVRAALGASRRQLLGESLTESLILAFLASVLGLALSTWGVDILLATVPNGLPSWVRFGIDLRVIGFTTLVAAVALALIGLAPAREAARVDLLSVLKVGGLVGQKTATVVRSARRLIVIEVALSVALFMGALLMVRSFQQLQKVDPGYDAGRVLSVAFGFDERYADITRERSFFIRLEERLQRAAGVEAVSTEGFVRAFRVDTDTAWGPGQIVSLEGGSPVQMSQLESSVVEPAFPRVLGLSVLEGRFLDDGDREGGERVTVLSRSLAQRLSPNASVVGRTITIARRQYQEVGAPTKLARVVGVIEDRVGVRGGRDGLRAEPRTELYFSNAQAVGGNHELLVRSTAAASLRRVVEENSRAVDPDQTIARAETLAEQLGSDALGVRIFSTLFGVVAGCALLLALIGMYGVVSYMAEQRRAEIGLRMALGATRRDIARQVVGYGLKLAIAGVGIGLVLGFGIGRLTRIMLFGVSVLDPLTCALVAIVFSAVAALSAYGPARRAMRVDPLTALRAQ